MEPTRQARTSGFDGATLDRGVMAFAVFTLLSHVSVLLGAGLDSLLLASAAAALVGIGFWLKRAKGAGSAANTPPGLSGSDPEPPATSPGRFGIPLAVLALSLCAIGAYALADSLMGYWGCALAASALSLLRGPQGVPGLAGEVRVSGAERAGIWALGALCALAVAFTQRGDADDAFYLNLVVAAVDHPSAPLLAGDTLHGFANVPMALPVFQLLSSEILRAGLARLTGLDAITLVHVLLPPLCALLIPLAWARLTMLLLPRRWFWVLLLILAQFFLLGDGQASHGDFALLRLQQGKSLLLHIALPLVAVYAFEFARAPSTTAWLRLAAGQIAAVGLSTSALWLAPAAAALAWGAALSLSDSRPLGRRIRDAASALAASLYPLAAAVWLRADTLRAFRESAHPPESLDWSAQRTLEHALEFVAGGEPITLLILFSLIAAPLAASNPLFRRYAALSGFAFFGFFFNPLWANWVAGNITGPDTYFRIFWLLPLPLLVAAVLSAPLESGAREATRMPRWLRGGAALAAALSLLVLPRTYTLSAQKGVRHGRPGPRMASGEWLAAERISGWAREGENVLAPLQVSRWIPLNPHSPSPLMVRELHLDLLLDRLGAAELERRRALTHLVGGALRLDDGGDLLADAVAEYPLKAVCLGGPALAWPELRGALRRSGLRVALRDPDYEIWIRDP
jgi:hypothetical protein